MKEEKEKEKMNAKGDKGSEASVGTSSSDVACRDKQCPFHGKLSTHGRSFRGHVTRIHPKRVAIEFERFIFIKKYERYARKKTRIHARLPSCLADKVRVGSYVKIMECRPLSKIIHHVVIGVEK